MLLIISCFSLPSWFVCFVFVFVFFLSFGFDKLILATGNIIRIGLLNWKKFSHLKEKGNWISSHPTERSSRTECSSGMVSCSFSSDVTCE
jgi:hypothetical protein